MIRDVGMPFFGKIYNIKKGSLFIPPSDSDIKYVISGGYIMFFLKEDINVDYLFIINELNDDVEPFIVKIIVNAFTEHVNLHLLKEDYIERKKVPLDNISDDNINGDIETIISELDSDKKYIMEYTINGQIITMESSNYLDLFNSEDQYSVNFNQIPFGFQRPKQNSNGFNSDIKEYKNNLTFKGISKSGYIYIINIHNNVMISPQKQYRTYFIPFEPENIISLSVLEEKTLFKHTK